MDIKLIIGLGNPDSKYQDTYHNVGALFAKYFENLRDSQQWIPAKLFILVSGAYVNESGKFIAKELKKSGAKPEELLVVHDDSDIELGKYKLSFGRGAAGHHGVESVQTALKTKDFWRLRVGIRPAADLRGLNADLRRQKRKKAGEFVLKKITVADKKLFLKVFEEATKELAK